MDYHITACLGYCPGIEQAMFEASAYGSLLVTSLRPCQLSYLIQPVRNISLIV